MQSNSKVINSNNSNSTLRQDCSLFIINGTNNNISVHCKISTLTVNGHNNNISYQASAKSQTIIVNGHNNNVNCVNVSMITINGSNNSIITHGQCYVYSNGVNNNVHQPTSSHSSAFTHHTAAPIKISSHGVTDIFNGADTITINIEDDKENSYDLDVDSDDIEEEEMGYEDIILESDGEPEEVELIMPDEIIFNPKPSGNSQNCIICMEAIKKGDRIRVLECAHMYHSRCIDQWVKESNTCPMCKNPVAT